MENKSWIKLFRKFRDWEWYKNSNVKDLFIELLLSANFEDKKWQGITVKRGQLIVGVGELGKNINLTRQQTRYALNKLKLTNEITIKTTNKYTIITINKYNEYQGDNQQDNQRVTNKQPTSNQQVTTTKEYKNDNNKRITRGKEYKSIKDLTDEDFEQIANLYSISKEVVLDTYDRMYLWHKSTGKGYKNYKAGLMNWIRRRDQPFKN